jgi:hypothetical protein
MTVEVNRHGLARYVPADVRRTLRQEAGFGCVKCGCVCCEYEHIDPEFADATEHDPAKMAFLCRRCHGEITAGRATKESVWRAKADPVCRRAEHAWGDLEFGNLNSTFGNVFFFDSRVLLRVGDEDLLTIDEPEEANGPIRVNAKLYEGNAVALQIEDNALVVNRENWDVELVGPLLTVRRAPGEVFLRYRFVPKAGVRIEWLDMNYRGTMIRISEERVSVGHAEWSIDSIDAMFSDCETCIVVSQGAIRLGDELGLAALAKPLTASVSFQGCKIVGGAWVTGGAHVQLLNCWLERGILIDRGSKLTVVAGVIKGGRAVEAVVET